MPLGPSSCSASGEAAPGALSKTAPGSTNLAETQSFMDDKKRILVFSGAGGTGRSHHADLSAKNQRKRVHYMLEPGWKTDTAIQGLGRSNRTNQAQPPLSRGRHRVLCAEAPRQGFERRSARRSCSCGQGAGRQACPPRISPPSSFLPAFAVSMSFATMTLPALGKPVFRKIVENCWNWSLSSDRRVCEGKSAESLSIIESVRAGPPAFVRMPGPYLRRNRTAAASEAS
jgi:hypothetical protein